MNHIHYNTHEKPPLSQWIPLSIQHVFAMFGGTILVPLLTGLSTTTALFTAGTGTLLYILVTRGKVPTFLGSSFAFIAPLTIYISKSPGYGVEYAMGGVLCSGLFYCAVAGIVKMAGHDWINKTFPPVVAGSVIITIGMVLAPTAVTMAMKTGGEQYAPVNGSIVVVTLFATIFATVLGRKFVSTLPVLIGMSTGYLFTLLMGILFKPYRDIIAFDAVREASWLALPEFVHIKFSPVVAIAFILVSLATICEHIGDTLVMSKVVGKNFMKDPGLHSTLLGDGLATMWASLWGGPPNTTYGENIGVLAITRVYSVWVIAGTAVFAIVLSLFEKVGEVIHTIPDPVMGAVCIVLFGFIAISGVRTLVDNRVDFTNKRNLMIGAVILSLGLGGATLKIPLSASNPSLVFELGSISVATLTGIILNLVLPNRG